MATVQTVNMTEAYAKALERAKADGIRIVGRGYRKADGARIVIVSSKASGAQCYTVAVYRDRLECDCAAGAHGRYCKHRAIAREALCAKALEAPAVAVAASHQAAIARADARMPAPVRDVLSRPAVRQSKTGLIDNNRPISIWK